MIAAMVLANTPLTRPVPIVFRYDLTFRCQMSDVKGRHIGVVSGTSQPDKQALRQNVVWKSSAEQLPSSGGPADLVREEDPTVFVVKRGDDTFSFAFVFDDGVVGRNGPLSVSVERFGNKHGQRHFDYVAAGLCEYAPLKSGMSH